MHSTYVILIRESTSFNLGEDQLPIDFNLKATYNTKGSRNRT